MIDLQDLLNDRVDTLIGRPRGEAARQHYHVDALDGSSDFIEIAAPKTLRSITPSFVQGMFGPSVRTLGGKEAFLKRYSLSRLSEGLRYDILEGIDRVMISRSVAGSH
ncbi:hypothetical protein [Devosia sp.]|uniref:hypothetical protein n=1 Tax=Devosia sp. TaxID=1871048 RepID=UPI002612CBCE|nr:hypothetical protein [Devosia sp.]